MNRREFLTGAALAATGALTRAEGSPAKPNAAGAPTISRKGVKPRNRRPYAGIDWSKVIQINGTTHMHQHADVLDTVKEHNIEFLTLSNYYPSMPAPALKDMTSPKGLPTSDWPVMVNGKRVAGPFDWNKIVSQWEEEIPEADRKAWPPYPFRSPSRQFNPKSLPTGLLEGPNAEHHGFKLKNGRSAGRLHLCAPGSAFASGTFDARNRKRTVSHGYCSGSGEFWGTAIDRMIAKLIVPDGGGVTINHPTWTHIDKSLLLELLDWDPRVLGLEVFESGRNSENYWDWVLATGRQCFGFFVPDHGMRNKDFGVCVLLVQERTVEACLRAYRSGNFYGSAHGLGELRFTSIRFDGTTVRAETDKPARLEVITARGVRKTVEGRSVEWKCPKDNNDREGPAVEIFARIRATALDGCGERLFTQASMLV